MVYRIWDTQRANFVADCATMEEAVQAIQRTFAPTGPTSVEARALEQEDDHGAVTVLAQGEDLLHVAADGVLASGMTSRAGTMRDLRSEETITSLCCEHSGDLTPVAVLVNRRPYSSEWIGACN